MCKIPDSEFCSQNSGTFKSRQAFETCRNFDVAIIGGGAVGSAAAYLLSAYDLRLAVFEKEADVAMGTSGRNSAVVHAGFNNAPGSLMAELCVEGNKGFEALARTLDVPYNRTGKLVVGFGAEDAKILEALMNKGIGNGCIGLSMIYGDEIRQLEPNVPADVAMHSANTAIFDPFLYNIHLAECAVKNGAEYLLNHPVTAIEKKDGSFVIHSGDRTYTADILINAAGLFADRISAMAGDPSYHIYPCRGEYYLMDKIADRQLRLPVYPVPRPGIGGLGVHLTPTINGNVIIGPSAEYVEEQESTNTTGSMLETLWKEAQVLHPGLQRKDIIGAYAGVRPKLVAKGTKNYADFVITESDKTENLIQLIGIESPALTAALPIARRVEDMVVNKLRPKKKPDYDPTYRAIPHFADCSDEERLALIRQDPNFGDVICRCETVTRAEVLRALHNPLGAHTITSVKNRTRVTMGRCNGGYCLTRLADILCEELHIPPEEIVLKKQGDRPFAGTLNVH